MHIEWSVRVHFNCAIKWDIKIYIKHLKWTLNLSLHFASFLDFLMDFLVKSIILIDMLFE